MSARSLQTLTGGGVFTQGNINAINANFLALQDVDVWLRPQAGSDLGNGSVKYPHGSYYNAFATMAGLASVIEPGLTIGLEGVLKENYVAPDVNDITIIGKANQPRQATDSGIANGGGATWLNPGTVASPLLHVASGSLDKPSQAWRLVNIFFNNAGDAPCVKLDRKITGADSSHASVYGCWFTGADSGIQTGEIINLTVEDCLFFDFTGSGDTGIEASVGGGIANPPYLQWTLKRNRFVNNVNHVVGALRNATIEDNNFFIIGRSVTTTIALSLDGGANNGVFNNMFNRPLNTSPNATLFVGGTNDVWSNNYGSDNIFFGVPDNS